MILADARLPPGDWSGGIVLLWPGSRWVSNTRKITDYQPGKSLRFDTTLETKTKDAHHKEDPYMPRAGNPYLLLGTLAGLDSPGEWFLDQTTGTVYLWTYDGKSPTAHAVEVKQRTGVGQEWVLPNWMINAPGQAKPTTWPAQVFMVQQRAGAALGSHHPQRVKCGQQ